MRDLNLEEVGQVYGGGGKGRNCYDPCGSKGSKSRKSKKSKKSAKSKKSRKSRGSGKYC
ncbi:MAG TPA: hypothetical protein VGB54_04825 [Allosphingosinicella sp.]